MQVVKDGLEGDHKQLVRGQDLKVQPCTETVLACVGQDIAPSYTEQVHSSICPAQIGED